MLRLSPSFSPAQFEVAAVDDNVYDELEMEEDEEAETAENSRSTSRSSTTEVHHAIIRDSPTSLVLNVNFVQERAKGIHPIVYDPSVNSQSKSTAAIDGVTGADDANGQNPSVIRITKVSIQPTADESKSSVPAHANASQNTHYQSGMSNSSIQSILGSLRNSILARFAKYNADKMTKNRKLIIYVRDVNEMLESGIDDGKKVFLGLLDLVRSLRLDHSIPVVLIADCHPSTAYTPNLEKSSLFYSSLYEEAVAITDLVTDTTHHEPWKSGPLFETSLDAMSTDFEKVELIPPNPFGSRYESPKSFLSSESDAKQGSEAASSEKSDAPSYADIVDGLDQISIHLDALQIDLRRHLRQINWRNVESVCKSKKIIINGITHDTISSDLEGVKSGASSTEIHKLLGIFETSIWPLSKIEKLVALAVGCRMEAAVRTGAGFKKIFDLSRKHFVESLKIIHQTDSMRTCRLGSTQIESDAKNSPIVEPSFTAKFSDIHAASKNATSLPVPLSVANKMNSGKFSAQNSSEDPAADIQEQLAKEGVKLNAYEKRILSTVVNPDVIKVSFSDLILPAPTKLMLQTLVTLPMLRPEFFETGILSRSAIHGALLFGPPGTGKTMLAKAVAKSSGARFMSVSLSNVFDKYVGEGEKNVRAIFTLARKLAPCVVFLDEVDALFGARRNDGVNSSRREIINEFMSEWDG